MVVVVHMYGNSFDPDDEELEEVNRKRRYHQTHHHSVTLHCCYHEEWRKQEGRSRMAKTEAERWGIFI